MQRSSSASASGGGGAQHADDFEAFDSGFLELLDGLAHLSSAPPSAPTVVPISMPPRPASIQAAAVDENVTPAPAPPREAIIGRRVPRRAAAAADKPPRRWSNLSRERMQRELAALRQEAAELEWRLQGIQSTRQRNTEREIRVEYQQHVPGPPGGPPEEVITAVAAFWERHAIRMRKAKQRALAENRRLRALIEENARAAGALQRRLEQIDEDLIDQGP